MTYQPYNSKSAYVPRTEVYPEDQDDLLTKLTDVHTLVANAVNVREIALYQDEQETVTGAQFSIAGTNNRKQQSLRKCLYFGAIATGATLNINHNIPSPTEFVRIEGTCITDVVDFRPIPFSSTVALNQQISIRVTSTIVEIINGAASPNITSGKVILEYFR